MADTVANALRKLAEKHVEQGCYAIMRAFDLTHEGRSWEFDRTTQQEVQHLMQQLIALLQTGDIRPKAHYLLERRLAHAKADDQFQRLLKSCGTAAAGRKHRG